LKNVSVLCDRCGSVILRGHSIIRLEAGELATRHDGPIDLCESCSDRFGDWLRSGRGHNGAGDTMSQPTVESILPAGRCVSGACERNPT